MGVCKMYYFCLDRLSCCRVSCDKARTAEQRGGGGTRGAVGNGGDRQDWQQSNTHNPNHISLPLRLHIYPHYRGALHAYKRAALYLHP